MATEHTKAERAAISAAYGAMHDAVEQLGGSMVARMDLAEKLEMRGRSSRISARALIIECFAEGVHDQQTANTREPADIAGYSTGLVLAWSVGGAAAKLDADIRARRAGVGILRGNWSELAAAAKAGHRDAILRAFDRIKP